MKKVYLSVLAGVAIGIAAICNLKSGGIIGASLFAFALSAMVWNKWILFTGKAGLAGTRKEWFELVPMLFYNAVGVVLAVYMSCCVEAVMPAAMKLVEARKAAGFGIILPSILTGLIMTVSVKSAREGQWIPLLLGIPTFVMSGFPHCVADIAYYCVAKEYPIGLWVLSIIGNFIGCNLPTIFRFIKEQKTEKC